MSDDNMVLDSSEDKIQEHNSTTQKADGQGNFEVGADSLPATATAGYEQQNTSKVEQSEGNGKRKRKTGRKLTRKSETGEEIEYKSVSVYIPEVIRNEMHLFAEFRNCTDSDLIQKMISSFLERNAKMLE